jgi:copper(I)-binding protein
VNLALLKPRAAIAVAALALAACQQHKAPEQQTGPDAKPGLSVSGGVLTLPAVKGNPGAAYFTVTNRGNTPATLAAVHIDGVGKTEMHESMGGSMEALKGVPVSAGETVKFEQGGKHVMLFDIDGRLTPGGTTEMTLVFSDGDKASTPLKIRSAGGVDGATSADMPGMDHGDHH